MGLDTIPSRSNGQVINNTWYNVLRSVLSGVFVPRDTSGVPTDQAGDLGSSTYRWLSQHIMGANFYNGARSVQVQAAALMPSDYNLTLPQSLPGSELPLTMDASGNTRAIAITQAMLNAAVARALIPTGTILSFGGPDTALPAGYLICDGTAVSRTTYADLYAVYGDSWGYGDNSTTFNIPDLRGYFLRGQDRGAGRDPDAGSRIGNTGGPAGDQVATYQGDNNKSHTHSITDPGHIHLAQGYAAGGTTQLTGNPMNQFVANPINVGSLYGLNVASNTTGITGTNSTGGESRPINASVLFIVKY